MERIKLKIYTRFILIILWGIFQLGLSTCAFANPIVFTDDIIRVVNKLSRFKNLSKIEMLSHLSRASIDDLVKIVSKLPKEKRVDFLLESSVQKNLQNKQKKNSSIQLDIKTN